MKKIIGRYLAVAFAVCFMGFMGMTMQTWAEADEAAGAIHNGIFVEDINLSGMTPAEAEAAVQDYVDSLEDVPITLVTVNDNQVSTTPKALGMTWENKSVIQEASALGTTGNVVERYKTLKDLEHTNQVYELELSFDKNAITQIITEECTQFNVEAVDAQMKRVGGGFDITEGQSGVVIEEAQSVEKIYSFLKDEWNKQAAEIELVATVEEPKGKTEELAKIKDVLGTFKTSYTSSGANRSENVATGCSHIDGTVIYPGEEFSTYETIKPFTEENGYALAGSYLNGTVVESLGGGICQVSTTLYNAVLLAELEITERHNHSMIINYVDPSADAAIAESAGKDFRFINNTGYPIYIEGITAGKQITFTIYGVETRDASRKVTYESEVLKKTEPENDKIIADASQPIGYLQVSSAHIGYTARLWKVVTENGVEVSRDVINNSSYAVSPRTATVGTSTENPEYAALMAQAIATANIDEVKTAIATIQAADAALAAQQAELEALAAQQAMIEAAAAEAAVAE